MSPRSKTVLVVDDNEGMRDTLTAILKRSYRVLTAETGEEGLADTADVSLDIRLSDDRPFIEGDVFALSRVYRNLVLNAIEATAPGGGVTLSVEEQEARVRISVRDTGTEIPHHRLENIFEDFETTKRRGLGLAISRKIVDQLGGEITVASTLGRGTTFRLEFDRVAASREVATSAAS
jgi:two-component system sensor histidine kinase BaeS